MAIKYISPEDFRDQGYLQEVNRRFLHPLGLAMSVNIDEESGEVSLGGIWDYRDDPEGILFADDDLTDKARVARITSEFHTKAVVRRKRYGFVTQPFPGIIDEPLTASVARPPDEDSEMLQAAQDRIKRKIKGGIHDTGLL